MTSHMGQMLSRNLKLVTQSCISAIITPNTVEIPFLLRLPGRYYDGLETLADEVASQAVVDCGPGTDFNRIGATVCGAWGSVALKYLK